MTRINKIKSIGTILTTNLFIFGVSIFTTPLTVYSAWGDVISSKITDFQQQLAPVFYAFSALALMFGAFQYLTASGNVDKRTLGKNILFGVIVAIIIFSSAPSLVTWASTNLRIEF